LGKRVSGGAVGMLVVDKAVGKMGVAVFGDAEAGGLDDLGGGVADVVDVEFLGVEVFLVPVGDFEVKCAA